MLSMYQQDLRPKKPRDLSAYFQPIQDGRRRSALVQRALFTKQRKVIEEVKEVTADVIHEVLFDIKLEDSSEKARRRHPPPLHAAQYRINVAKLESIGGLGLLLELQGGRQHSDALQPEWPATDFFDVILHEDDHGWRTIKYVDEAMQAWSLDMSHPMIHSVWTLYRCVGTYVDLSSA
jgi:hypothetical protein